MLTSLALIDPECQVYCVTMVPRQWTCVASYLLLWNNKWPGTAVPARLVGYLRYGPGTGAVNGSEAAHGGADAVAEG